MNVQSAITGISGKSRKKDKIEILSRPNSRKKDNMEILSRPNSWKKDKVEILSYNRKSNKMENNRRKRDKIYIFW